MDMQKTLADCWAKCIPVLHGLTDQVDEVLDGLQPWKIVVVSFILFNTLSLLMGYARAFLGMSGNSIYYAAHLLE